MNKIVLVAILLVAISSGWACARNTSSSLQRLYRGDVEEVDQSMIVPLSMSEIVSNTDEYLGTFIETQGNIISLCSVGCFFFIQDESEQQIYVNLAPKNFDVPQSAYGQRVRVMGILEKRSTTISIVAYEVEFLDVKE